MLLVDRFFLNAARCVELGRGLALARPLFVGFLRASLWVNPKMKMGADVHRAIDIYHLKRITYVVRDLEVSVEHFLSYLDVIAASSTESISSDTLKLAREGLKYAAQIMRKDCKIIEVAGLDCGNIRLLLEQINHFETLGASYNNDLNVLIVDQAEESLNHFVDMIAAAVEHRGLQLKSLKHLPSFVGMDIA